MKLKTFLSVILALVLTGCVRLGFAAANLPANFTNATITKDIAYGPAPLQKLDVYVPKQKADGPRDVLVFFYGGRWESGTKAEYKFVADTFVDKGFIVVMPDYRKYPVVKFPVFVEDAAQAVAWTYANIANYGGNPARIHVAGHSAGAHLGSLVVSDERYLKALGYDANKIIKSFAGLAGPYDFTPDEPDLMDMFGPPVNYPNIQATTFIDGHEAPMLLMHGTKDDTVKVSNLEKFEAKIIEKHGRVQTKLYDGVDHLWIAGALSWLGHNKPPVADDMAAFFRSVP